MLKRFASVTVFWLSLSASANDGAAGLAGGDLHFKNLKGVQMEEEVLDINPGAVNVRYRFRNTTAKPITTLISFPIVDDIQGDANWDRESKNPNHFSVTVDGKITPFETKIETKEDTRTMHHHWTQTFPANKTIVIEHTYVPIFESGVMYMEEGSGPFWGEQLEKYFCATSAEAASVVKKGWKYKTLTYILKTARTWDGPIKSFKLKIDKGVYPRIFLCTELKLRKKGDVFEAEAKNFVPKDDLNIAYVGKWKD